MYDFLPYLAAGLPFLSDELTRKLLLNKHYGTLFGSHIYNPRMLEILKRFAQSKNIEMIQPVNTEKLLGLKAAPEITKYQYIPSVNKFTPPVVMYGHNKRIGGIAHELGHATQFNRFGKYRTPIMLGSAAISRLAPIGGFGSLFTSDENTSRNIAMASTAASLPNLFMETDASMRGANMVNKLNQMNERKINSLAQKQFLNQSKPTLNPPQIKNPFFASIANAFKPTNKFVSPSPFNYSALNTKPSFKVPIRSPFMGLASYAMSAASPLFVHYGRKALGGFDQQNKQ